MSNFMCHGMVIDQDGGLWACKYAYDDLKCKDCEGLFCDTHFEIREGRCVDCMGREPLLKEDY